MDQSQEYAADRQQIDQAKEGHAPALRLELSRHFIGQRGTVAGAHQPNIAVRLLPCYFRGDLGSGGGQIGQQGTGPIEAWCVDKRHLHLLDDRLP